MGWAVGMVVVAMSSMWAAPPASPHPRPAPAKAEAPAKSDVGEAKRLYSIGEHAMAEGRAAEAVSLWRQAIVLLPATGHYDALRHKLVLRLGYGMLAASEETGDRGYASDAARMLDMYATRHEELFGDAERAKLQRGEIYELLYVAESKLEAPTNRTADDPSRKLVPDEGAPEIATRKVVVPTKRKRDRPSIDDPRILGLLRSRITEVETGLYGLGPHVVLYSPARGMVRMNGIARAVDGNAGDGAAVHGLARAALISVRPALRSCFDQAYARTPTDLVATEVELVVETDGSVSKAKLVGGPVIDAAGSRCVVARLADARVDERPGARVRVRVPLQFFWEGRRYVLTQCGTVFREGDIAMCPEEDTPTKLQPIDEFFGE